MEEEFHIHGLKEFRAAMKQIDRSYGKVMGQANKMAADIMAQEAASRASSGTKQQAASASTIRAVADQLRAKVRGGGAKAPFAQGAFFGARLTSRFGWYADEKYAGYHGHQFLPWVGNQWIPGDSLESSQAQGSPYIFGAAIHAKREEFLDAYGEIWERLLTEHAFNE